MVRGNAVYESQYLLGTSIARPLIAKAHIDIAREFDANAVATEQRGKEMTNAAFELTFLALAPDLNYPCTLERCLISRTLSRAQGND